MDSHPLALHVHGRVIASEPLPVDRVQVYVLADSGRDVHRVLAVGALASEGVFDIRDVARPDDADQIIVAAGAPGWATVGDRIQPNADGDVAVDLAFNRARTFSGRVLDADGRPVVGLRIAVMADWGEPDVIPVEWFREGVGSSLLLPGSGLRGETTTDAEGQYVIRGLSCGGCSRAFSLSPEWFLLSNAANRDTYSGRLPFTAWPSATLDLTVTDATTGSPVEWFSVDAASNEGKRWTTNGRRGRLEVAWPRSPARNTPAGIDLSVRAEGFLPATGSHLLRADESAVRVSVALRPAVPAETGRLVVSVSGPGARAAGDVLLASLRVPGHSSVALRLPLFSDGGGRFAATAPAGSWLVEAAAENPADRTMRYSGTATVVAGRDAVLPWSIPALGTLTLWGGGPVWAGDREDKTLVLRGTSSGVTLRASLIRKLTVPVGDWSVSVEDEGGTSMVTRTVRIEQDKETSLRFDE